MPRLHTDRAFAVELETLRERLLLMGAKAEEMLRRSVEVLRSRDPYAAERARLLERQIDALELELDQRCLTILARWKPVASDLRLITTALKVVTQIERIGDHAETIARRSVELEQPTPESLRVVYGRMAEHVTSMVSDALDAFSTADVRRARVVIMQDEELDACYAQCFPHFLQMMTQGKAQIDDAIRHQAIAAALERVGDQATNLAEMVLFLVQGRFVRLAAPESDGTGSAKIRVWDRTLSKP